MLAVNPVVVRPDTRSKGVGMVTDCCKNMTGTAVVFHPGLAVCERCFLAAVRAYLEDAATRDQLAAAIRAACEEAAATVVQQAVTRAAAEAGQAVAARVLEAVGTSLGL